MKKSLVIALIVTVVLVGLTLFLIARNKAKKSEDKNPVKNGSITSGDLPKSFKLVQLAGGTAPQTSYEMRGDSFYKITTGGIAGYMEIEVSEEDYMNAYLKHTGAI